MRWEVAGSNEPTAYAYGQRPFTANEMKVWLDKLETFQGDAQVIELLVCPSRFLVQQRPRNCFLCLFFIYFPWSTRNPSISLTWFSYSGLLQPELQKKEIAKITRIAKKLTIIFCKINQNCKKFTIFAKSTRILQKW